MTFGNIRNYWDAWKARDLLGRINLVAVGLCCLCLPAFIIREVLWFRHSPMGDVEAAVYLVGTLLIVPLLVLNQALKKRENQRWVHSKVQWFLDQYDYHDSLYRGRRYRGPQRMAQEKVKRLFEYHRPSGITWRQVQEELRIHIEQTPENNVVYLETWKRKTG